jgi:hypothetical protein
MIATTDILVIINMIISGVITPIIIMVDRIFTRVKESDCCGQHVELSTIGSSQIGSQIEESKENKEKSLQL